MKEACACQHTKYFARFARAPQFKPRFVDICFSMYLLVSVYLRLATPKRQFYQVEVLL